MRKQSTVDVEAELKGNGPDSADDEQLLFERMIVLACLFNAEQSQQDFLKRNVFFQRIST